jgi:glycosyltransferase involved in cell wall biosynthesis
MSLEGISILIPVYNYDVTSLVKGLVLQCSKIDVPTQIIVYEDGSSLFLSENYSVENTPNVAYFQASENIGRSAARQFLAEKATFQWVLFLDADVLPVSENFITNYITSRQTENHPVVCGGLAYKKEKPETEKVLRWKYGREREEQSVEQRIKYSHFITSANVLYKKNLFFTLNTELGDYYGDDLIISQNIKNKGLEVIHINNPVYHLGLETSLEYLQKAERAVAFVVESEKEGKLDTDFMGFQKAFIKLNKMGVSSLALLVLGTFEKTLRKNLTSVNPSLFYFDMYRLLHFLKLKKEKNA